MHLFHKKLLYGISSLIGVPLKLDDAATDGPRPSFARLCVELDLLKERPDFVWIGVEGKFVIQRVIWERCPQYCSHSSYLGHGIDDCQERMVKEKNVGDDFPKDQHILLNKKKGKNAVEDPVDQS